MASELGSVDPFSRLGFLFLQNNRAVPADSTEIIRTFYITSFSPNNCQNW